MGFKELCAKFDQYIKDPNSPFHHSDSPLRNCVKLTVHKPFRRLVATNPVASLQSLPVRGTGQNGLTVTNSGQGANGDMDRASMSSLASEAVAKAVNHAVQNVSQQSEDPNLLKSIRYGEVPSMSDNLQSIRKPVVVPQTASLQSVNRVELVQASPTPLLPIQISGNLKSPEVGCLVILMEECKIEHTCVRMIANKIELPVHLQASSSFSLSLSLPECHHTEL